MTEEIRDTDADCWDSGCNLPDVMDETEYSGEPADPPADFDPASPDATDTSPNANPDANLGTVAGENNLGNEPDGAPDPDDVKIERDLEPLDDSEIDDRGFDCD